MCVWFTVENYFPIIMSLLFPMPSFCCRSYDDSCNLVCDSPLSKHDCFKRHTLIKPYMGSHSRTIKLRISEIKYFFFWISPVPQMIYKKKKSYKVGSRKSTMNFIQFLLRFILFSHKYLYLNNLSIGKIVSILNFAFINYTILCILDDSLILALSYLFFSIFFLFCFAAVSFIYYFPILIDELIRNEPIGWSISR